MQTEESIAHKGYDKSILKPFNPYLVTGMELSAKADEISIDSWEKVEEGRTILKQCQATEKEIESKRVDLVKPYNDTVKQINEYAKKLLEPTEAAKTMIKGKILDRDREQERIRQEIESKVNAAIIEIKKSTTVEGLEEIRQRLEGDCLQQGWTIPQHDRVTSAILGRFREINEEIEEKKRQEEADRLRQLAAEGDKAAAVQEAQAIAADRSTRAEEANVKEFEIAAAPAVHAPEISVKGVRTRYSYEVTDFDMIPSAYLIVNDSKIKADIKQGVKIPGINVIETKDIQ